MRRAAGVALVALALVLGLLAGRSWRSCAAPLGPRRANLLLVSIDTLRADHLGSYGYAAAQTPNLDALAARGWRFAQATTVVPLTLPAHSSLLTGTFPAHHGVRDNGASYLADEQITLAEVLREQGYRTGAFVGAFVLDSRWGLDQGFDRYFDDFDLSKYEGAGMDAIQRPGDEVVAPAREWLEKEKGKPFFAWVHLYDPHTPYEPPGTYRTRFPSTPLGAYDGEIAWTDALVGRLLEGLAGDGRLDRTVVVVLGDHGESLGEHREATHGFFVYDATIQIPLLVSGPGIAPRVVGDQVRIVDVMPTALELLGVSVPRAVQGQSLVPLGRGERKELVALTESWYPRYHYGWSQLTALRDGRFKLIEAPRPELFDLQQDPGELADLSAREPARVAALRGALGELMARHTSASASRAPQAVDPEAEERLQALGYVGGAPSARNLEERPRGDPKDKIDLYNLLKQAGQDAIEGRLDDAVARASEALAKDPDVIEGYVLLGNVHSKAKRYEDALAAYRKALARDPENQRATFSLALTYKELGRLADAEAAFERARRQDPRRGKTIWQLADIGMQRGRLDRAEALLKEGLTLKADRPSLLLKLGECYIEMKRYPEARDRVREALQEKPDLAGAHYDMALIHEAGGETEKAIAEYEAEIARNDKAYRASFNLAKLLLSAGRAQEAARRFRQSVEAKPDFGTGHLYLAKALLDAGDLPGALEAAQKGLASKPERSVAPLGHYVLADVYARQGRSRDAAREVAAARRLERGG